LGAHHDGIGDAKGCSNEEGFIMHYRTFKTSETTPYHRNSWFFSTCSVESFKKTLILKDCVKLPGQVYKTTEWSMFMMKEAGDFFTPNMQCYIIYGPHHVLFG
ncbi:hypothetical protein ACJMK2_004355, partial [Sinanodonta woodiana]